MDQFASLGCNCQCSVAAAYQFLRATHVSSISCRLWMTRFTAAESKLRREGNGRREARVKRVTQISPRCSADLTYFFSVKASIFHKFNVRQIRTFQLSFKNDNDHCEQRFTNIVDWSNNCPIFTTFCTQKAAENVSGLI